MEKHVAVGEYDTVRLRLNPLVIWHLGSQRCCLTLCLDLGLRVQGENMLAHDYREEGRKQSHCIRMVALQ